MIGRGLQKWPGALLLVLALAIPGFAQQPKPDLQQEIELLKKGQQTIQNELKEIKKLLQTRQRPSRPAAPNVSGMVFNLQDKPIKGENTAMLTLIEFTDYQ